MPRPIELDSSMTQAATGFAAVTHLPPYGGERRINSSSSGRLRGRRKMCGAVSIVIAIEWDRN